MRFTDRSQIFSAKNRNEIRILKSFQFSNR